MNKIVVAFLSLLIVFCGSWIFKSKTPLNRKINDVQTSTSTWWASEEQVQPLNNEVSEEWYLDPRIPADYVPVLDQDNLYMQVDENGKIVSYWECSENGDELKWEKVNPDVPNNYEKVKGLEDVYKVTDKDNNVKYYKYVRNDDNSFTFVEVDRNGNIIDDYITKCETEAASDNDIPSNYMQFDGNIYAVKNKDGVVVKYKEKNEDSNGNLTWSDADKSKIDDIINGYKKRNTNNSVTNPSQTSSTPSTDDSSYQAQITVPQTTKAPEETVDPKTMPTQTQKTTTNTHTQKSSYQEVKTEGDYRITYKYTIINIYDDKGNLLSTKEEGPEIVKKEPISGKTTPEINKNLIEVKIDNEISRVTSGLKSSDNAAKKVINTLNASRTSSKLTTLKSGGDAQKLATLFAADMSIYDNTTNNSPMYGTIQDLINRYNISNKGFAINTWRTTTDDATTIHKRFQSIDNLRKARMNANFNQVGVAIYQNNGYYYIAEVLLLQ